MNYIKTKRFFFPLILSFILILSQLSWVPTALGQTLEVQASADPSSGEAPLNDVDVSISVSGTATGTINYKIDCTNNGTWEREISTDSTSYTAVDLCDYSTPGNYQIKVFVERDNLSYQTFLAINVSEAPALSVQASANPSSGYAPLNDVDVSISVSGTATGTINYKIDCTNDGIWEREISSDSTTYTASDLCDYASAGTYSIKIKVERQGLAYETTLPINVYPPLTLYVDLEAIPSSGYDPLNDVDLKATVSGTAIGNIDYKFDCTNDGIWELEVNNSGANPYTASDLCDYATPGTYTPKVWVSRDGLEAQDTTNVLVEARPTLSLTFSPNPSVGKYPLNDVDLRAEVSGTATGLIDYKFDCQNDGIWEREVTTSEILYTAADLCDYPDPGNYTAKAKVEKQGLTIEGTATIIVLKDYTLSVNLSAIPAIGDAPLNDVDLRAQVLGTAEGDISYKFDCTGDGTWEREIITDSADYTASDLCDYTSVGIFNPKVKVKREGVIVEGDTTILVK